MVAAGLGNRGIYSCEKFDDFSNRKAGYLVRWNSAWPRERTQYVEAAGANVAYVPVAELIDVPANYANLSMFSDTDAAIGVFNPANIAAENATQKMEMLLAIIREQGLSKGERDF